MPTVLSEKEPTELSLKVFEVTTLDEMPDAAVARVIATLPAPAETEPAVPFVYPSAAAYTFQVPESTLNEYVPLVSVFVAENPPPSFSAHTKASEAAVPPAVTVPDIVDPACVTIIAALIVSPLTVIVDGVLTYPGFDA